MNQERLTEENDAAQHFEPKFFGADGGIHPDESLVNQS